MAESWNRCHVVVVASMIIVGVLLPRCGPGGQELAPASLVVEPTVLKFDVDGDSESLVIKNSGGESLTFAAAVSASFEDVTWLKVAPDEGAVETGGAASLLVSVKNRDLLAPAIYQGKIVVTGEGLKPVTVNVTLEVGQPVLELDPSDVLDFGTEGESRNLIIKNTGAGKLKYAITMPPDNWLTADAELQGEIAADEPRTVKLVVDRDVVPWYGDKSYEMVVTSNGLEDESHSSTAQLEIRVEVPADCEVDSNCTKEGYYCQVPDGDVQGECKPQREVGQTCGGPGQCKSGICVEGVCCDGMCGGQCESCALEGLEGTCTSRPKGTACDDGLFCTDGDSCLEGECQAGEQMDCSADDSSCSSGTCSEEAEGCVPEIEEGWCRIEEECFAAEEANPDPDLTCRVCDPDLSQVAWSTAPFTCFIDGECHNEGDSLGAGGCLVCFSAKPDAQTKLPNGEACKPDDNDCTADVCQGGECTHEPDDFLDCDDGNACTKGDGCVAGDCIGTDYADKCDDGLACTTDACDGEGGCVTPPAIEPGWCLVNGNCYEVNDPAPNSHGCKKCQPDKNQYAFTDMDDGKTCDDQNLCTVSDVCLAGSCEGEDKPCDDGILCTVNACDPLKGECEYDEVSAGFCLIEGKCHLDGGGPDGPDGDCKVCSPNQSQTVWTATAENQLCNDLSVCTDESECVAGVCTAVGPMCDDGLGCTVDICTEEQQCEHEVAEEFCLIGGVCVTTGVAMDGSAGCIICAPDVEQADWSYAGPETDCDDKLPCTLDDYCLMGTCKGEEKACDDELFCTEDSCDVETGECQNVRLEEYCIIDGICRQAGAPPLGKDAECRKCDPVGSPNAWLADHSGEPCDDLSECTAESVCDDGLCVGQGGLCDDGNECTVDTCTAEQSCQHDNADDQSPCKGDGVGCTSDICLDGACQHPPAPGKCVIADTCHNDGDAAPGTTCSACDADAPYQWTAVNEGLECSDDQWCTVDDACLDGVCTGAIRDCGGDDCNFATCGEDDDKCYVQAAQDGTDCEDGDPCTVGGLCVGGACKSTPKDCSFLAPDNDCMQTFCDPVSEPQPGECKALPFPESAPCDDGLFCNVEEGCDGEGECVGGAPRDCAVFGQCHTGWCSEDQVQCVSEVKANDSSCNADNDGCTMNDSCQAGECKPGPKQTCANVADTCNTAKCESLGTDNYACNQVAKGQGVDCDDGEYCTVGEKCDGAGGCLGGSEKDCSGQVEGQNCLVAFCNDLADECTVQTAPDNYVCDDGDACTLEDICQNGNCVGLMDGCAQRDLTLFTHGTSNVGFSFIPRLANLGSGEVQALWLNHGSPGLRARIIDRESSIGWNETNPTNGFNFGLGNCYNEVTHAGLAARANGDWIAAFGYRRGEIYSNVARRVKYSLHFAVFDRKGNSLKWWTQLYYGQLYSNNPGWAVNCSNVPHDSNWGTWWPDDYVDAFAFSDGSFAVLDNVSQEQLPYYYPISSNLSVGAPIPVGGSTSLTQMTGAVLSNDNIVFTWVSGLGGTARALVADRNMNFQINPFYAAQFEGDPGHQYHPRASALPNNRFIIAFQTMWDGGPGRYYFQVFNADGTKSGSLRQAYNAPSTYHGQAPCAFADGGAVTTFMSKGYDADQVGIGATVYDSNYNTSVFPFQVNDVEAGHQTWPLCAVDGDDWLAVWATNVGQGENKLTYHFKRFARNGDNDLRAPERRANQHTSGHQEDGAAEGTDSGFVVAWESAGVDGNSTGVALRTMNPDGSPATMEQVVNQQAGGPQFDPELAWNSGSSALAVVWTSSGQVQGEDVFARLYESDGSALTDEFQVNQGSSGNQGGSGVAAVSGGDFVFLWSGDSGQGSKEIYARRFSGSGSAIGNEFQVNQGTPGDQVDAQILSTGSQSSQFIAFWRKSGGGGQDGLYARILDKSGAAVTNEKLLVGGTILNFSVDRDVSGVMALCYQTNSETYFQKVSSQLVAAGGSHALAGAPVSGKVSVAVRDSNRFWVIWERTAIDATDGGGSVTKLDMDMAGNRYRMPVIVNWHTPGNQLKPFTARLASDDVVVGWESDNQDGGGSGIYYRVLD